MADDTKVVTHLTGRPADDGPKPIKPGTNRAGQKRPPVTNKKPAVKQTNANMKPVPVGKGKAQIACIPTHAAERTDAPATSVLKPFAHADGGPVHPMPTRTLREAVRETPGHVADDFNALSEGAASADGGVPAGETLPTVDAPQGANGETTPPNSETLPPAAATGPVADPNTGVNNAGTS